MSPTFPTVSYRWVVRNALCIVCLAFCSALPACVPTKRCEANGDGATLNCTYTGPEMQNARFEVAGESSLHPSNTIWLREGESVIPLWDTFTMQFTYGDELCDFSNFTQFTDDCALCDYCDETPASFQRCNAHPAFFGTNAQVVFFEGFIEAETPGQSIELDNGPSVFGGCSAAGYAPTLITPTDNGTYQLLAPEYSSSPYSILAQKKVFVIKDQLSQSASYRLTRHPESNASVVWFKWAVAGDPVWEDNFTTTLRVGLVRVLKGGMVVRPSRIVLRPAFNPGLPVFNQDTIRCYANQNTADGDIDLTRCRTSPNGATQLEDLTPTYYKLQMMDLLTWIVEFNPNEGADADPTTPALDPIDPNDSLTIEFTIQRV